LKVTESRVRDAIPSRTTPAEEGISNESSLADTMEYKMIYRAYRHAQLMSRQGAMRDQEGAVERDEAQYVDEARDWSNTLNGFVNEGFAVKNSGALPMADSIVFWALLERA
jgi:hypothetical protein